MRIAIQNNHDSPVEIITEQADARRSLTPGQELVIDWTWSGFADLTFGSGWVALATPPGGSIAVADPVPGDVELWNGAPPGEGEMSEFWIHNATEADLTTLWEPWCEGALPPGAGPMRIEWTPRSQGVGMNYEPGYVVVWDLYGSCRAWQPDGVEVLTGGTKCHDPDGKYAPAPVPGWPIR